LLKNMPSQWLQGWKLDHQPIYVASRDGWNAADFHRCADGRGPTLVVAKSTGGYIFGGLATQSWSQIGTYTSTTDNWIFTLGTGSNPVKLTIVHHQYAMHCAQNLGPIFGGGNDLCAHSPNVDIC